MPINGGERPVHQADARTDGACNRPSSREQAGVERFQAGADQDLGADDDGPSLFGHPFDGPMPGHGPGMPVHYDLHVWLFEANPDGQLAAWNPGQLPLNLILRTEGRFPAGPPSRPAPGPVGGAHSSRGRSGVTYRRLVAPRAERPDMAGYGVPDSEEGVLPWSWAEERLLRSRSYWITTVSPAGRPHSLPVWGVWLARRERFWFSCATTARKARNLRAVPSIVVAPTDTVEVVSLEGRAVEVTGGDLDEPVLEYWQKYGGEMEMEQPAIAEFLTSNSSFEVIPERAFGIIERPEEFSKRATRWRWPSS